MHHRFQLIHSPHCSYDRIVIISFASKLLSRKTDRYRTEPTFDSFGLISSSLQVFVLHSIFHQIFLNKHNVSFSSVTINFSRVSYSLDFVIIFLNIDTFLSTADKNQSNIGEKNEEKKIVRRSKHSMHACSGYCCVKTEEPPDFLTDARAADVTAQSDLVQQY